MKYDVTLVIGNGFDLDLGLPTRYSDFLNSEIFKSFLQSQPFEKFPQSLYRNFLEDQDGNWIDVELYLKYSAGIELDEFNIFVECFSEYLKSLQMIDFDKYKNSYALKLISELPQNSFIVNFNYTDTVQNIWSNYLKREHNDLVSRLIHVHGSLKNNDIIIGVDEGLENKRETTFLKKFSNHKYKNNNLNEILNSSKNVVFFGHSFGETDHSYFDEYFYSLTINKPSEERGIFLLYYGEGDWYNKAYELSRLTKNNIKKLRDNTYFMGINIKKGIKEIPSRFDYRAYKNVDSKSFLINEILPH